MKKIASIALIIGLLVVPSAAFAMHGADDVNHAADVRQEDRQQVNASATTATTADTDTEATETHTTAQTSTGVSTHATEAENETENQNEQEGNITLPTGSITLAEATTIAENLMPGKTVQRVETENEEGAVVFDVRFTDGSRVDVKATDGTVLRTRTASDDDDNSGSNHSGDDHSGND